jgi:hypothetical protein
MRVLSDDQWRNNRGHLFGAFVFEHDGLLAGLVCSRSTVSAFRLPCHLLSAWLPLVDHHRSNYSFQQAFHR